MKVFKTVIVDDHKLFRKGLRLILQDMNNIEVVAEASNGQEFLDLLNRIKPDMVLMDINMPLINGIEATSEALKRYPELKIIALSMFGESEYYERMVEAGVKGFLLKNSDSSELENALQMVIQGQTYFSQELLLNIINQKNQPKSYTAVPLSNRETEVLQFMCKGLTNAEIAESMFISQRTVDRHKANLLSKTNCKNSIGLVMYAVKHNLVKVQ
ncbi:MAG: response regulator [Marinifilaceae bacterium]|jgi:DNA-binding NarL/FixJ family response regulator